METINNKLERYIESWSKADRFSGSVIIADMDKTIFQGGFGFANEQYKIKNTISTKHNIASFTKQFTAVAILKLYDMNKLMLEDRVDKFIPEYRFGDKITIHQLLCHSSGIPEHTNFEEYKIYERIAVDTIIDRLNKRELDFNPGENTDYSNSNYVLLGRIIEIVSRKDIDEFFKEVMFEPIGLKNTGVSRNEDIIMDFAQGYTYSGEGKINSDYYDMSGAFGSGFLYSTVEDILIWTRALLNGQIISHDTLKKMLTPNGHIWYMDSWAGYGCLLSGEDKTDMRSNGLISGHVFNVWVDLNRGYIVILLGNNDSIAIAKILIGIKDILLKEEALIFHAPKEKHEITNQEVLKDLHGKYVCKYTGGEFNIISKNNNLFVDHLWTQKYKKEMYKLLCINETEEQITFCCEVCEGEFQFIINQDKSITDVTFKYDMITLPYTKC